jgi:hypothetical protein
MSKMYMLTLYIILLFYANLMKTSLNGTLSAFAAIFK